MNTRLVLPKSLALATGFVLLNTISFGQKATYNMPTSIENNKVRLTFQKVSAASTSYYVNYKAENTGDGILVIDRKRTSLKQNGGELYPSSDTYTLKPGKNKTVYNQFRVKAPIQANADLFTLQLNGLSYANPTAGIKTEKLVLAEKATQNIGPFGIKVMEYNVYSDRIYVQLKCMFNGSSKQLGNIDLSKLVVSGGSAEVVKKGDVVFPGKSYTFSINISPNGDEASVNFNEVLSTMELQKIAIDDIVIKSTKYVEPKEETPAATEAEAKPVKEDAAKELSFSDFMSLKKDIEQEMNTGGKPVEMAHEFLMEKGNISVAQIADILTVFNLDGSRLKFAKMAYTYASDKQKYHMIVGKLEYTKNKQALEEFLEHQ